MAEPNLDCLIYRELQADMCRACKVKCCFREATLMMMEYYKKHVENERKWRELIGDYNDPR